MENKLTNYIALTLAMILLSNIMCCIGILIFQTPQENDLLFFVLFDMIMSIIVTSLLLNTITKNKQYVCKEKF
jgi:hypothetical protein